MGRQFVMALPMTVVAAMACTVAMTRNDAAAEADRSAFSAVDTLLRTDRLLADLTHTHGLTSTLGGSLANDVVLLYPGVAIISDLRGARRLLTERPALKRHALTWVPLSGELSRDRSMGMTYGVTVWTDRASGSVETGKYLTAWRRHAGGAWRIAATVWIGVELPHDTIATPVVTAAQPESSSLGPLAHVDRAFARLAGDSGAAVAFTRYAAPNAVTFGGLGEVRRGPAQIGAGFPADVRDRSTWAWVPVFEGRTRDGEFGFTVGESEITVKATGVTWPGKYLTIWRRQSDGSYCYLADGGNARPKRLSRPSCRIAKQGPDC